MPTNTNTQKKAMIQALEKSLGIVTTACKSVGINRTTHYEWIKTDPAYKEAVDSIQDVTLDFGESMLHKRMKEGSDAAIIFFMKTKGKHRGFSERYQVTEEDEETVITVNHIITQAAQADKKSPSE